MMVVGGINLIRAGFEVAEYTPMGPNETLMKFLDEIENVLMLWFPLFIMCVTCIALLFKIGLLIMNYCSKNDQKN